LASGLLSNFVINNSNKLGISYNSGLNIMKRLFDIILSFLALLLFACPLLIILAVQAFCMGRPFFFRQERAGRNGITFSILKFRTMCLHAGSDDERSTQWGRFLRSTSLDELPELWNVLRGEMSLVGPRPLPIGYLPLYSSEQAKRHQVLPGITGWAQVNGRNGLTWERQFELDLSYIAKQSLVFDIKILFLTIWTVLRRKDINASALVTREAFKGSTAQKIKEPKVLGLD
jgi:lipopolysaccharide/colanic/teichoic acid biosynthesis glycosyltransferase